MSILLSVPNVENPNDLGFTLQIPYFSPSGECNIVYRM